MGFGYSARTTGFDCSLAILARKVEETYGLECPLSDRPSLCRCRCRPYPGIFKATPGSMGTRMNSALSENEGSIFVDTRPFLECSISRFELIRQ